MNENEAKQYRSLIMEEAHKMKRERGDSHLQKGDTTNAAQVVSDALGLGFSGSEFLGKVFAQTLHKQNPSMLPFPKPDHDIEQTPEQILQAIEKRHAEEIQQAREEIAKILKNQESKKNKNELWAGVYVYVYFEKRHPDVYKIRSRQIDSSTSVQISAFENIEQSNKLAQSIDKIIKHVIGNATRDTASA
jgi:hypothetical protein